MIEYKIERFFPTDAMFDLISANSSMLMVIGRFGISLGVGEDTIEQVCQKHGVDTYTFLAVVNLLIARDKVGLKIDYSKISLPILIKYLHKSHHYFIDYRLPTIRTKLIEALDSSDDVSVVIISYFDSYFEEVSMHMNYEEEKLFPYISALIDGKGSDTFSIDIYSEHHDKVEEKLSELKNIIIRYYSVETTNALNSVLYDIFACEKGLALHGILEDYLLVPAIKEFEQSKK
ncbi:MAG: hemerythrin domain-containing protein [Rikenellaceae bacterium]